MFKQDKAISLDLDEFFDKLDRLIVTMQEVRDEVNRLNELIELNGSVKRHRRRHY